MIDIRLDLSGFTVAGRRFSDLAKEAPAAINRAVNHTGDKAKTAMKIALVVQTGLKRRTMDRALRSTRAGAKGGSYIIRVKGGEAKLSKFGARETRAGVSAAPFNSRRIFARTFIKGGRFPNRVGIPKLHGQVFIRSGSARYPIKAVRSGVILPNEMLQGRSAQQFYATVERDLPARIAHELARIL